MKHTGNVSCGTTSSSTSWTASAWVTSCCCCSVSSLHWPTSTMRRSSRRGEQLVESIFIQNSKLYMFGLIFNSLTLLLHSDYRELTLHCGLFYGHNIFSIALVFVTACPRPVSRPSFSSSVITCSTVLTGQITTVIVTALSLFLFDFRPSIDFFLQAPVVLLAIFIYHSSKLKDPEYTLQQERLRVINGEVFERSRGVRVIRKELKRSLCISADHLFHELFVSTLIFEVHSVTV